jgi:hypothetical protein
MSVNKKNIIKLDVNSALAVMQEIYLDISEQKNNASIIMKKMLKFMKDAEDMTTIGPVIKDQQKILNDCTEKKISLVKIQSALLKQMASTGGKPNGAIENISDLNDEDRQLIELFMKNGKNEGNDTNNKPEVKKYE